MTDSKVAAGILFGAAALAAAGFGLVTRQVRRGGASRLDLLVKRKVHRRRSAALARIASATAPAGKWYAHLPAALLAARRLQARGHTKAAIAAIGTSVGAAALSRVLDRVLTHRSPPPERGEPKNQSYPSAHALETSALAVAGGYLMVREQMAPVWSVAPLGLWSLSEGAGKLVLDRHWTSDVIAGYCAGIAFGATCAGLYELSR